MPTVSSKQCDRCLAEKGTSEFVTDKYSPDGLKKRCKLCMVRLSDPDACVSLASAAFVLTVIMP